MLTHPDPVTLFDEIESPESVNYGRQGKYFDHFDSTEFFYRDKGIAAAGVNSTPDITPRQIENVTQHFNKGPAAEFRIFCAHHSFMPVPTKKLRAGDIVPRSADILQSLIELNVNLLCCGHIHRSHVWELSDGRHRLLCCNAGSLLDTSGKKDNGYLEIEVGLDVRITKRTLFSDRTEVLYHRLPAPRNSSVIKSNQYLQSLNNNGAPKQLTSEHDAGEGRSKLKKAKGKR